MRSPFALRLPKSPRLAALLFVALAVGCASPLSPSFNPPPKPAAAVPTDLETKAADDLTAAAVRKATGVTAAVPQDQAFANILGELQEIRAIDPEAERQLIDDLKEVKPENYAVVVETFRTALAYRQQLAAREQAVFAGESPVNEYDAATRLVSHQTPAHQTAAEFTPAQPSAAERSADAPPVAAAPESPAAAIWPPTPERPLRPRTAPQAVAASNVSHAIATEPAPAPLAARGLAPPADEAAIASDNDDAPAPLGAFSTTSTPLTPLTPVSAAVVVASPEATPPAAPLAPIESSGDWQTQLHTAIADLERTVAPKPTTVSELHDHMRLRTLQLLAGNETDAFRPIPGASPAQQDYWSKQLFAISAYLSATGKLDEKQRAMAALAPLDEARARLSELASLQIRNLSFVKSVDGFGAYEPNVARSFQPGEKVVLYAEVENYSSQASETGYHTSLGTSFQVLDKAGHRVDGKQFPEVEDKCRNRRRDFHMQYELALPERIYPGTYDLELTITDHHSGKIGQATLTFEISAEAPPQVVAAKK